MLPVRKNSTDDDGRDTARTAGGAADSVGDNLPRILRLPVEVDLLNRLTVGHVVLGFLSFRSQFVINDAQRLRSRLLDRQTFADLEAQQHQLDLGTIDREQFAVYVEQLVGDHASNVAFAGLSFWGAAVCCAPRHRFSRMLRMTTAQRRRARVIFRELHDAIAAARAQVHGEIRAELTVRQAAILDDPRSPLRANTVRGQTRPFADELREACALQGDQQASVTVLCALLRTAVRAQHERGRVRFIRSLSAPQRRLLEVIENIPPLGSEGGGAAAGV